MTEKNELHNQTPEESQSAKEVKFALEDQWNEETPDNGSNPENVSGDTGNIESSNEDKAATELQQELEIVKQERDEYLNDIKRLQAEFDNFRKRSIKERSETREYMMQDFFMHIIGIIENLERAVNTDLQSTTIESYHQGVQMVYQQLMGILNENGLTRIKSEGEKFDPNLHEAVAEVETDEHESGTIVQEYAPGYRLKERVLKAPKVQIAK